MKKSASHRIWHVGNWCMSPGQTYADTLFKSDLKDVELLNYAQPFGDALRWKQVFAP